MNLKTPNLEAYKAKHMVLKLPAALHMAKKMLEVKLFIGQWLTSSFQFNFVLKTFTIHFLQREIFLIFEDNEFLGN